MRPSSCGRWPRSKPRVERWRRVDRTTRTIGAADVEQVEKTLAQQPETLRWVLIDLAVRAGLRGHLTAATALAAAAARVPRPVVGSLADAWHQYLEGSLAFERRDRLNGCCLLGRTVEKHHVPKFDGPIMHTATEVDRIPLFHAV